jgi:hypothetical protein
VSEKNVSCPKAKAVDILRLAYFLHNTSSFLRPKLEAELFNKFQNLNWNDNLDKPYT